MHLFGYFFFIPLQLFTNEYFSKRLFFTYVLIQLITIHYLTFISIIDYNKILKVNNIIKYFVYRFNTLNNRIIIYNSLYIIY